MGSLNIKIKTFPHIYNSLFIEIDKMSRIFVGGLPEDASRGELEKEFEYFGRLKDVWVARNPPGFGFIIFDDSRDAEDAVKEMDGKRVCGSKIRVEFARGPTRGEC